MKPVAIFRHEERDGPGYLQDFLERRRVAYELIRIDAGDRIPAADDYSGLAFMGGPMSVNEDLPWIARELALIRNAHEFGLPMLGHCLGGQLISKALGGSVTRNPVEEIGWHEVEIVEDKKDADWATVLPQRFVAFHWHNETFSLPPGAAWLLRGRHCRHQGFTRGNVLAVQCHIEMTEALVMDWMNANPEKLQRPTPSRQSRQEILEGTDRWLSSLQEVAGRLYDRWLRFLHPGV